MPCWPIYVIYLFYGLILLTHEACRKFLNRFYLLFALKLTCFIIRFNLLLSCALAKLSCKKLRSSELLGTIRIDWSLCFGRAFWELGSFCIGRLFYAWLLFDLLDFVKLSLALSLSLFLWWKIPISFKSNTYRTLNQFVQTLSFVSHFSLYL